MESRESIEKQLLDAWNVNAPNATASNERNIQIQILLDIRELLTKK